MELVQKYGMELLKKLVVVGLFFLPGFAAYSAIVGDSNNANIANCCVECAKNGNKEAQNCLARAKMSFEAKGYGNQQARPPEKAGVGN